MHARAEAGGEVNSTITSAESSVLAFRRFFGVADKETLEITRFDRQGTPSVAYVRDLESQMRLLWDSDRQRDVTGVYTVFNTLHEGLHARYGERTFVKGRGMHRASDADVTHIRGVYLDFDVVRPREISATDAEKQAALDISQECEAFLASELGTHDCLARGDSGNGYALFIALEPFEPNDDSRKRIDRFLRFVADKYSIARRVKVDTSVGNPARLCPAFGTMKRKGHDCPERPHRPTSFACSDTVVRVPVEAL